MACRATNNRKNYLLSISNMPITQTESGKAWEYGLACQLADMLNRKSSLEINAPRNKSQESYDSLHSSERRRIDRAANEAALFLRAHDPRLLDTDRVVMQSDMMSGKGDVRDILIFAGQKIITGIAAKHRHDALKHPRLSRSIDFGKKWYDRPCSKKYWTAINPVFSQLHGNATHLLRGTSNLWRSIPNKRRDIYKPVLGAFIEETVNFANPTKMMRYLLGQYDFYKIIKENGNISLQSFNMSGSLKWGKHIPLPDKIVEFSMKPRSSTTAILNMNQGWQISFRIHNANKFIEPSLKFDVRLIGSPQTLSRHEIPFD